MRKISEAPSPVPLSLPPAHSVSPGLSFKCVTNPHTRSQICIIPLPTHTHTHISFIHRTISCIQVSAYLPNIFIFTHAIYKHKNKETSSWSSDSTNFPQYAHQPLPGHIYITCQSFTFRPDTAHPYIQITLFCILSVTPSVPGTVPRPSNPTPFKYHPLKKHLPFFHSHFLLPVLLHAGTHAEQNQR